MSDNIHVAIRVRPLIEREKNDSSIISWQTGNTNSIYQVDKKGQPVPGANFMFDRVFSSESQNREVYEQMCHPIVESVTEGFHGTVFAYGQTSSGKTYTMMGRKADPGVVKMAVQDIFAMCQRKSGRQFQYWISYMEIYNEKISDLIANTSGLVIKENIAGQVFVSDLEAVLVTNTEQVFKVMEEGEKNRHFGSTSMNERSSRSHTIFKMVVESKLRGSSVDSPVKISQLNLVDLAGSEKAGQMGTTGVLFKEGVCINKSLLTLSQVISKLSEGAFVNYRDSKLTRILQNSLGGNSRTAIICTVTPAVVDQTLSTLNFACSAKHIQNKPVVNEVLTEAAQLRKAQREIASLKTEISHLRTAQSPAANLTARVNKSQIFQEGWASSPSRFASIPENSALEEHFEAPSTIFLKSEPSGFVTKRRKCYWTSLNPNATFSQEYRELQKQVEELVEKNFDLQQHLDFLKDEPSLRERDSFPDQEKLKHDLSDYKRKSNVLAETLRNREDLIKDFEETVKNKDSIIQDLEYTIIEREVQQTGTYLGECVTFSPITPRGSTVRISTSCQTDKSIVQSEHSERTELLKVDADTQTTTCIALQTQLPIALDSSVQTDTVCLSEASAQTVNIEVSKLDSSVQTIAACAKGVSSQTMNPFTLEREIQTDDCEAVLQKDSAVQTNVLKTEDSTCQTDLPLTGEFGSQTEAFPDPMFVQTFVDQSHSSEKEVAALKETVLELEEEIEHWKRQLGFSEELFEEQQAKLGALEEKLAFREAVPLTAATGSQTEFPDAFFSNQCDVDILTETNQELEEEIEHWKGQTTMYQELLDKEIDNNLHKGASNTNHLQNEIESLRLEVNTLRTAKSNVDQEVNTLRTANSQTDREMEAFQSMVESLKCELRKLYTEQSISEQKMETLQSQVLISQSIAEEKSRECDLMSRELTDLHTKFRDSQPAIQAAVKEATKHKTNSLELQVEYKQLLKKNEELNKKVDFYQNKVRETENKLRRASTREMDNTVVHLRSSTPQEVGIPALAVVHEGEDLSASCGIGYISKLRISMLEKELSEVKKKHNRLLRFLRNCNCASWKTSADYKENVVPTSELSNLPISSKEVEMPVTVSSLQATAYIPQSTLGESNFASLQRNTPLPRSDVPSSSEHLSVPRTRFTPVPHSSAQFSGQSVLARSGSQDRHAAVGSSYERQRISPFVPAATYASPLPKSQVPMEDFTFGFDNSLPKPKKPTSLDNADGCPTQ